MCDDCGCSAELTPAANPHHAGHHVTLKSKKALGDFDTLFEFQLDHHGMTFLPGQFVVLHLSDGKSGAYPISSSILEEKSFQIVAQKDHRLTHSLQHLQPGTRLHLTGPLGNSYPMNHLRDKPIVFLVGTGGFPAAFSALQHAVARRDNYKELILVLEFENPSSRLYDHELAVWKNDDKLQCLETVRKTDGYDGSGKSGDLTVLLEKLTPRMTADTHVIIAGPQDMIRTAVKWIKDLKIPDEQIIVNLHYLINCGLGECGECKNYGIDVCTKGPVFYYHEIRDLIH